MSKQMQIEFGKTWREKFAYLIVTGIFMFGSTIIFRILMLTVGRVETWYFQQYEMFYNIAGAAIGFILSQIFIRMHIKAMR